MLTNSSSRQRDLAREGDPCTCRLLLAVAEEGGASAKNALFEGLLGREIPLVFMIDPQTRAAQP